MGDGVEDRYVGAVEQQLPGERGAVERPSTEHGHQVDFCPSIDSRRMSACPVCWAVS